MRKLVLCVVVAMVALGAASAQAVTIWSVDIVTGQLITFESTNPGVATVVGSAITSLGVYHELDFDETGALYGLRRTGELFLVNKATAAASHIGTGALPAEYVARDLSWDPANDRMLCLAGNSTGSAKLLVVDLQTAALTDLGDINGTGGFEVSIATDADGTVYLFDVGTDLWYRLDASLNATPVGSPFDSNLAQGATIDWSRDRALYQAAWNADSAQVELDIIDKTTGAATLLGPLDTSLAGTGVVQVASAAIDPTPEPATLSLLALGGLALLRRRQS